MTKLSSPPNLSPATTSSPSPPGSGWTSTQSPARRFTNTISNKYPKPSPAKKSALSQLKKPVPATPAKSNTSSKPSNSPTETHHGPTTTLRFPKQWPPTGPTSSNP